MSTNPSKRAIHAAVDMEVHAACATTTLSKAEALDRHFPDYDDLIEAARPFEEIIQESTEDLPDSEPVTVEIGDRVIDLSLTLANFRALQAAIARAEGFSHD